MSDIKTQYNSIPCQLHHNYLKNLINRVFKILPMKEEKSDTLDAYISALLQELTGNRDLILYLKNDSRYEMILSNLQSLQNDEVSYRATVFNTISIIKQLAEECEV